MYILSVFRCLILEVIWPIVIKLCHMISGDSYLQIYVINLVGHPLKIWWPKNVKILVRFLTTWRLDHKHLRTATRHRQSANGVANCDHPHAGLLNLLNFGSSRNDKNRTRISTHPKSAYSGARISSAKGLCYVKIKVRKLAKKLAYFISSRIMGRIVLKFCV